MKHKTKPILKIFYLDDEKFDAQFMKVKLEEENPEATFIVKLFYTIENLLSFLDSNKRVPDIFLLDYHFENQEQNGFYVARELKRRLPKCVIIFVSNHSTKRLAFESKIVGADDFISKLAIRRPDFHKILLESYYLSLRSKGMHEEHGFLSEYLTRAIGTTLKAHILRIPSLLDSAVTSVLVSGEPGTGKGFFLNIFIDILKGKRLTFFELEPEDLSKKSLRTLKTSIGPSNSDWIIFKNINFLDIQAQKALSSFLNTMKSSNTRFLFCCSDKEALLPLLQSHLGEVELHFPPLRDRRDEIRTFVEELLKTIPGGPYYIDATTFDVLMNNDYCDKNVSELKRILKSMTSFKVGMTLTVASLPTHLLSPNKIGAIDGCSPHCFKVHFDPNESTLEHYTDMLLAALLRKTCEKDKVSGYNTTLGNLAIRLGITRQTLAKRVTRLLHKQLISKDEKEFWYGG